MANDSQDLGKQVTDQAGKAGKAGGKVGKKAVKKAIGKVAKALKKLLAMFMKKVIMVIMKALAALLGPIGCLTLIAVLLFLAILASIPFADWFLGGGKRSTAQVEQDVAYEQEFKDLALASVSELDELDVDPNWLISFKNMVMPSWGIPAALAKYQIVEADTVIELPKSKDLFKDLEPTFHYETISSDREYFRIVETCTFRETWIDDEGVEQERLEYTEETTYSEYDLPDREVLSKVVTPYGELELSTLTRYYPGGYTDDFETWDYYEEEFDGDCTSITYRRWTETNVDDRGVPALEIDSSKLMNIILDAGVPEVDVPVIYEFASTADENFMPYLFDGYRSLGLDSGPSYTNATYTYDGPVIDGWVWPVAGFYNVTSPFGDRPLMGGFHYGVDLGGTPADGAPILAALDGIVIYTGWDEYGYGNWMIIAHDGGLQTRYAHMSSLTVQNSAQVSAGDQIGVLGSTGQSTGPHLHFEVLRPGKESPYARSAKMETAYDPMFFLERLTAN